MKTVILAVLVALVGQNVFAGVDSVVCDARVLRGQKTLSKTYATIENGKTEFAVLPKEDITIEIELKGESIYATALKGEKLLGTHNSVVPKGSFSVNGFSVVLSEGNELMLSCEPNVSHVMQ